MKFPKKENVLLYLRRRGFHCKRRGLLWHKLPLISFIAGVLGLAWLALRSGSKPSRITYPCQQAALSTAGLAFGGAFAAALVGGGRRISAWLGRPAGLAASGLGLLFSVCLWGFVSQAEVNKIYEGPRPSPPKDYYAQIYHVGYCPDEPANDRFLGIDNLILLMGRNGQKFYQSSGTTLVSGPQGIVGTDDVVLIKINYQWSQRGGSNMDVMRGLISRIVNHPDGFDGEIVICENVQWASSDAFNRSQNNAQDNGLSPHDVATWFQGLGYDVSHYDWKAIRSVSVDEYSEGDMNDGYIVYPYDGTLHGRVSYPKFQTDSGTYISLRDGIWNPEESSYDQEHLKFINLPVLKSHHATYGVTACVKHHMGTVSGGLSTNSHNAIHYGILGAFLGEIEMADLNILDCIWINANPYSGPGTSYSEAVRRNELIAGFDPVAIDRWAASNILIPAFIENGYSPPWPSPSADPDDPASAFRQYLDNSMYQILDAGFDVTNDPAAIIMNSGKGFGGDFDLDGDVDLNDLDQFVTCFTGQGGGPIDPACSAGDFDGDGDIDCDDWENFSFVWTEQENPPVPDPCITPVPAFSVWGMIILVAAVLFTAARDLRRKH